MSFSKFLRTIKSIKTSWKYNQGSREKRRIQEELRKRRTVKDSNIILSPGETDATTTTVPAIARFKNETSRPKGAKRRGRCCVPSDGDDYNYG